MQKEIRVVDKEKGIMQITLQDERWYSKSSTDEKTKLPIYKYVPSVTWITGFYPAGIGYYKWLASKGWDESQALMEAAGNKGSKIHLAVADILLGKEVRIDTKYPNRNGEMEELTSEEIEAIQSFLDWQKENPGEVIAFEVTLFSDKNNYAGTCDLIYKTSKIVKTVEKDIEGISGKGDIYEDIYWLIDFKTGQNIWPSHEIQISAYRECIVNGENSFEKLPPTADLKLAILQIGYKLNRKHFKFTEIEPQFDLFLAAQKIWTKEAGNTSPKQRDYNIILSPAKVEEKKEVEKVEKLVVIEADRPEKG